MSKFKTTHELNCSQDKFWAVFFDKAIMNNLDLEAKGYEEYKVIEQEQTESAISQKEEGNVFSFPLYF